LDQDSPNPLPALDPEFDDNFIEPFVDLQKAAITANDIPTSNSENWTSDSEDFVEPADFRGIPVANPAPTTENDVIPVSISCMNDTAVGEVMRDGVWYRGELKNGKRHGKGECSMPDMHFSEPASYVGEFRRNQFHGKGVFMPGDGSYIEANWVKNKVDGVATKVKPGVYSYVGAFLNEKFEGFGQLNFQSENLHYIGEFRENKFNGVGNLLCRNNGNKMIGNYENGVFKNGECHSAEGFVSRGHFTEDFCLHGQGTVEMPNGMTIEANFDNGKPVGGRVWCRYQNGEVREGVLVGKRFFPKA